MSFVLCGFNFQGTITSIPVEGERYLLFYKYELYSYLTNKGSWTKPNVFYNPNWTLVITEPEQNPNRYFTNLTRTRTEPNLRNEIFPISSAELVAIYI